MKLSQKFIFLGYSVIHIYSYSVIHAIHELKTFLFLITPIVIITRIVTKILPKF